MPKVNSEWVLAGAVLCALLGTPFAASSQSVSIGPDILLYNSNGVPSVWLLASDPDKGQMFLGGAPFASAPAWGHLQALDTDGVTPTVDLNGAVGLLTLGNLGEDGDIWVQNNANERTFDLDGNTGNVLNALNGNGIVKAWAIVDWNGNVQGCWRCDPAGTAKIDPGYYEVDFSPLATTLLGRPLTCSAGSAYETEVPNFDFLPRMIKCVMRADDLGVLFPDTIAVRIWDQSGTAQDSTFTVVVY